MSTPIDPVNTPNSNSSATSPLRSAAVNGSGGRLDGSANGGTSDVPADDGAARTTSKWSDADVSDGAGRSATRELPVHYEQQPDHARLEPAAEPILHDRTLPDDQLRAQPMAVGAPPDRQTVVAREHERFGGMKFGSAFFGWLTATGLAVLLLAILAAAGVAFGIATTDNVDQAVSQSQNATGTAKTVGLVGAIVLLVILFVAYYCGGYVAGRMARFDGVKQGLGVWIWAIITSAVIAVVAAIAGAKYNVLAQLNLPRIPVDEGSVTTVGIIAIAAAILVALLGALLGGAVGTRYHRKVDAVGFDDTIG